MGWPKGEYDVSVSFRNLKDGAVRDGKPSKKEFDGTFGLNDLTHRSKKHLTRVTRCVILLVEVRTPGRFREWVVRT